MRTDQEQIAWYREIRSKAEEQLRLIEQGWRFERGLGSGTRIDVTDETARRERLTVETMTRLIDMYEGRFA